MAIAAIAAIAAVCPSPAHALSSHPLFTILGAAGGDNHGISVASAGDVNGDGYPDVIVGAIYNDAGGAEAGRAYVYFGGPAADATADLVLTGAAAGDQFGGSVASAGDVNGDGFDDVIVGATGNDAGGAEAGRAYVYFGGSAPNATADLTLTGEAMVNFFGGSVAGAGDVNGDGYDDLIVGAARYHDLDYGRAYVYYGGSAPDAAADLTITGAANADFLGSAVAGAGDLNDDGFADFVVGAPYSDAAGFDAGRAYVYFGGSVPDATADVVLAGEAQDDNFGNALASAGDVNGDGFADLIVGARGSDAGGSNAGRAYVFYGGTAVDAAADLILTGSTPEEYFGASVASAGDVNGDGFADVVVGAPLNSTLGFSTGQARVFLGGTSADATADLTLTGAAPGNDFGNSVAGAGDFDRDGFGDLIIGAPFNSAVGYLAGSAGVFSVYPYRVLSPNGGEQWVAGHPASVRWRGHDVADLSISFDGGANWSTLLSGVGGEEENQLPVIAPTVATSGALVRLSYRGQPVRHATSDLSDGVFRIVPETSPPAVARRLQFAPTGAAANESFGTSVASAGDLNGDGFGDVVVGGYQSSAGGPLAGRACVYFGGATADATADLILTGAAAGDALGFSVAPAGDVNGDGYDDLIVGAFGSDDAGPDAGRAYVYFGGPFLDSVADLTLTGAASGDWFGYSVASAGDVNGDGFADVIVGAIFNDAGGGDAGRAYVYFGGPSADATADLTLTGAASSDFMGTSVAGAGDVNGDGFDDVIVGANWNDAGGLNAGRAYVYFGGRSPDTIADLTLTGAAAGDQFGRSVAAAGDVNGDGFADLLVGAWLNDAAGTDAGRAYVYLGGASIDATADLVLAGAAELDNFGISVASAGDLNTDGFDDVAVGAFRNDTGGTNAGRVYVYFGGAVLDATADVALNGSAVGENFGFPVASAGDVNGDGFVDLIAGANANDVAGTDAGRAYLYDFNRYFVLSPNDDELWNVGASQSVSWLGAERADLWLSTDGGATYELLRHDVGGDDVSAVSLLAPHAPTRFARVKVTPADPSIRGADESDSTFTIQSSVALLSFVVHSGPEGIELSWSTEPGVGPSGLAGYRLYRLAPGESGNGTRVGHALLAESRYVDPSGAPGSVYRLTVVNGLMQELEVGRLNLASAAPLAAWPLPYRGGDLSVSFGVNSSFGQTLGEASVELFDLSGRRVKTIARGRYRAGHERVTWDGRDDRGAPVRTGMYFLRASSGGLTEQLKLVIAR